MTHREKLSKIANLYDALVLSETMPKQLFSSSDSERTTSVSRLARNRKTARLRRQKKKAEAEKLTLVINDALSRNTKLKKLLHNSTREDIQEFTERNGSAIVSGCLFCDKVFVISSESSMGNIISEHYLNDHPHLVRNNKDYLGEDFLTFVDQPPLLLDHVRKLSQENNLSITKHDSYKINASLSSEEKRKVRLQRNAQSARFCRQRKKLYMQKLRLELPKLLRENEILEDILKRFDRDNKILEEKEDIENIYFPKMNGWDTGVHVKKKSKLNDTLMSAPTTIPNQNRQKVIFPGIDIYEAAFALSALRQE